MCLVPGAGTWHLNFQVPGALCKAILIHVKSAKKIWYGYMALWALKQKGEMGVTTIVVRKYKVQKNK